MNFYIKQKFWKIGSDSFAITDDMGRSCYLVSTNIEWFSWSVKKFNLMDLSHNEIYFAKERLMRLRPRYDLYPTSISAKDDPDNSRIGFLKKTSFLFPRFKVKTKYGNYVITNWSFANRTFKIRKNGKIVGVIQKKLMKIADTYTVEVPELSEAPMVLTISLVLDQIYHKGH